MLNLKDFATQNLRNKGSSNLTPDEDKGRISSGAGDGSNICGGDDDDIFPIRRSVSLQIHSLIHDRALMSS